MPLACTYLKVGGAVEKENQRSLLLGLGEVRAASPLFQGVNMVGKYTGECYKCIHKREVPGNCHIQCVKPDPSMTGDEHGIRKGWFMYPLLFDPVWKMKPCSNYTASVNPAVSLGS